MGNPKHMWTAEEEAALRKGIAKHGAGKWSTILKDPEFHNVLILRSNVNLKDKWRNVSFATNGESRHKNKPVKKDVRPTNTSKDSEGSKDPIIGEVKSLEVACEVLPKGTSEKRMLRPVEADIYSTDKCSEGCEGSAIVQGKPPTSSCEALPGGSSGVSTSRLNDYKLKAVTELKGSCSSMQRKEQDLAPPNSERLSWDYSKLMTDFGKFNKQEMEDYLAERNRLEADADAELMRMRRMTPQEADAYAAECVRMAEIAVREAEMAEEDAAEAERAAKEAQDYYVQVRRSVEEKKSNPVPAPVRAPKRRKRGGMR